MKRICFLHFKSVGHVGLYESKDDKYKRKASRKGLEFSS